jgi:hypothetical protein
MNALMLTKMRLTDEIIDFNLISDFPFEKPFSELKTIDY